jgi:hypothetical protein
MGVSLGGYVSSLVASLERDLACVIAGVPVVDLVNLMEDHAPANVDGELRPLLEPARHLNRVVSPLAMRPAVERDRRFIYAGVADRVIHPKRQVTRLWEHWERPEIHWFRGGHLLFFRAGIQPFVQKALERTGLLPSESASA